MAVINNAAPANNDNNGTGFLLGVVLLIVFLVLIFYYGIPMMRGNTGSTINVPGKIDVNINHK